MPTQVEALIAKIREQHEAATKQADLYGRMLRELEEAASAVSAPKKARAPKPVPSATSKKKRRAQVKAAVSASDAVLALLAGCKTGLPSSEIVQQVSTKYGHLPNSLRTTLYNLKKRGAIVQDEQRTYHHAENVG